MTPPSNRHSTLVVMPTLSPPMEYVESMQKDNQSNPMQSGFGSLAALKKVLFVTVPIASIWTMLFLILWIITPERPHGSADLVTGLIILVLILVQCLITVNYTSMPLWLLVLLVVNAAANLVLLFAHAYWVRSAHNCACMNTALTKLDSVYFTLTTLTTVGYGDINPETQLCRAIVSVQLVFGVVLFVIILALLVARILEHSPDRKRQRPRL